MGTKKKKDAPSEHICYICGEVISGGHIYIRTKRRSELHIHYGCMNVRRDQDEDTDYTGNAHKGGAT